MKKSALLPLATMIVTLLAGCSSEVKTSVARVAYETVGKYKTENSGKLPANAAELSSYAVKKGIALPTVVDINEQGWKTMNVKPRPAISTGALKGLAGYWVNPATGNYGIATESEILSSDSLDQ